MSTSLDVLPRLEQVIAERFRFRPANSYTTQLFEAGMGKIGEKVLEEAAELVEAAGENNSPQTIYEAADLLYHTLVLLAAARIPLDLVASELQRRFGLSGLEEKARRGGP